MARQKRSFRKGCRDAYTFWIEMDVDSGHNYNMEVLRKQLNGILVPWNSSVEKILRDPPHTPIYHFVFGAEGLTAADSVAVEIVCKMNEMEQRWEEMQRLLEPRGFMEPEHNVRVDVLVEETRHNPDDCGFKRDT